MVWKPQCLRALTVIHNYGFKHENGTPTARGLFGTEYPELFFWLTEENEELRLA
jgi:hypothetical protein